MKRTSPWDTPVARRPVKHYHSEYCWRVEDLFATRPWMVRRKDEWVADNHYTLAALDFMLEAHQIFTVDTLIFTETGLSDFLADANPALARAQRLVSLSRSVGAPWALTVPEVLRMVGEFTGAQLPADSEDVLQECLGATKGSGRVTLPIWNVEGRSPNHFPLEDELQQLAAAGWLHTWGQYVNAGFRKSTELEFEVLDWRDAREVFSGEPVALLVVPEDLRLLPFVSYVGLSRLQTSLKVLKGTGGGVSAEQVPENWVGGLVRAYPVLLPRSPLQELQRQPLKGKVAAPLDVLVSSGAIC